MRKTIQTLPFVLLKFALLASACSPTLAALPAEASDVINTAIEDSVAEVNEALCKGCGACAPICPKDAITVVGYTDDEIEAMIDAFVRDVDLTELESTVSESLEEETADGKQSWVHGAPR